MTPPEPYASAAAGEGGAVAEVARRHAGFLGKIERDGRARYGELGIGSDGCARSLARIVCANLAAERTATPGHETPPDEICDGLVAADIYLAEALLAGVPAAWTAFEDLIETAWRTVRSHFAGHTSRRILEEIRESILGTFFLDRKVASWRATAPLGAWARQVIFNLFRQRMNERKSGREGPTLSQIGDSGADSEGLLPPSREPPPPDVLDHAEWSEVFARVVPEALGTLDRDERRMLEVLPTKRMTQVQLCRQMGISPFKLNRWYKDVRRRFLRDVTHRLRLLCDLDEVQADRLVAYLAGLWNSGNSGSERDFPQEGPSG